MHFLRVPAKLQDELGDLMRFIDRMPYETDLKLESRTRSIYTGPQRSWSWVVPAILPWNARRNRKSVIQPKRFRK